MSQAFFLCTIGRTGKSEKDTWTEPTVNQVSFDVGCIESKLYRWS